MIGTEPGRDSRARTPTKGLRVRLRKALIDAGWPHKFRTDERRNKTLVVITASKNELPFTHFEGRPVIRLLTGD